MLKDVTMYSACVDCYATAANGVSESATEEQQAATDAGLLALVAAGGHITTGDDVADFSWRPCEVCGSVLGGSRHEVIVLS